MTDQQLARANLNRSVYVKVNIQEGKKEEFIEV